MTNRSLLDLSYDDLTEHLASLGQAAYRAQQIWQAVYKDLAPSYEQMTTLPAGLRTELAEALPLMPIDVADVIRSADGRTRKTLGRLGDGETIETVTMDYEQRHTVCVSTQVGCPMDCKLCATGQSGFTRNLSSGEIVGQVLQAAVWFRSQDDRLSNVVYMGMGEPLANYDATLASVRVLNDERGLNLAARSFTISTVGIIPEIERLASEGLQVNLAVSLHAADDELRSMLVPANRQHPLSDLLAVCRHYTDATHRRITFEMALIDGVNDSPDHARRTAALLRGLLCHVNLIPFNPVPGLTWRGSSRERIQAFHTVLDEARIPVTIRMSRGADIQAGCGQLRARNPET